MKKVKQNLTTLYIVRHGQTEFNVKGLMQGHNDSPLTNLGEIQACALAEEFKDIHFDEVYSSDLLRAKRTAEIITLERNITIKTTQALRERSYGSYEGKPYDVYNRALEKLLKKYKHASEEELFRLPLEGGGESREVAAVRFITFLREISVALPGKTILVVVHGGIMRY
ncbi:MAG: histidine phosphatase family protein, partial [Patescibacteria group bacterium]